MRYSQYESLLFERKARVLFVTLNRPESGNAVNGVLHRELSTVFYDIAMDQDTDVVVLTGSGKNFCVGGDLKWLSTLDSAGLDLLFNEARAIINGLLDLEKPVVVALNGLAVGFGATLALFGDVVFASAESKICDPHVSGVAVTAGDGAAIIWPWLIGVSRAKELLMTGDVVSAGQAEKFGLVNHVVPTDELFSTASALAERLATLPQKALRGTKVSVNQVLKHTAALCLETSLTSEKSCFGTPDNKEAMQAFFEKRKPVFGMSAK